MSLIDSLKSIFKSDKRVCSKCNSEIEYKNLIDNNMICPHCGAYMRMSAFERISKIADQDTFVEFDKSMKSDNIIDFPDYNDKLSKAAKASNLNEAVVCGVCEIQGSKTAIFVMDSAFMMGSMGTVVGEKITRLFEYAKSKKLPVVGFITSGGARMQEGILSLMQMAKVSGAVRKHSDEGNLYIAVLTDPTTGGITASFAMLGDIIIAEPKALIGFAGQRVIQQTTGEKLPEGFQRSEFQLEHGFVDMIEQRDRLPFTIGRLLKLHGTV